MQWQAVPLEIVQGGRKTEEISSFRQKKLGIVFPDRNNSKMSTGLLNYMQRSLKKKVQQKLCSVSI